MIFDLKKQGSSCHWIPSLYLGSRIRSIISEDFIFMSTKQFSRMHVSMDIEASILVQIPVLVVVDGKAGLIIELLEAIDGEATRVFHIVQLAGFEAFVVVRLSLASLPSPVEESPDQELELETHLLQKVSLLGMLVGGIRLFPSDQNLEILEILRKEYPENIGDIAQRIS